MKLLSLVGSALLPVTMLALPACNSDEPRRVETPAVVTFAPEEPVDGASVSLRGRADPLAPSRVVVDVVARGVPDIHGAAFRVTWDVEALSFVEATSGRSWSKTALAMAKEGSPGQLAVAWTEKGELGIDATEETVLGTLVFEVKGRKGSLLGFKTERSQLVDKKGVRIEARWRGDALTAR